MEAEPAALARPEAEPGALDRPEAAPAVEVLAPALVRRLSVYGAEGPRAGGVRVVLELDRALPETRLEPLRPGVFALDLPTARLAGDIGREIVVADGLAALELEEGPEGARVYVNLAEGAAVERLVLASPPRVVLSLRAPGEDAARAAAARGDAAPCLMLDPGHGGSEWGASNGGVRESHLTLDLAERAAARLRAALPGMRVELTRDSDRSVSLDERVRLAEACRAQLFVSIHLNDSSVAIRQGGVTTFIRKGSRRADTRRLAERVHESLLAAGRATLPTLADRGVRGESFAVLERSSMPAVLVEASFMNDPEELRALRSSAYRDSLAAGIADGVLQYLYGE